MNRIVAIPTVNRNLNFQRYRILSYDLIFRESLCEGIDTDCC